MPTPCDPAQAPIGDVGTAVMMIDSRLKTIHSGRTTVDPEQQELIDQYTESMTLQGVYDVLDGACTLVYVYMKWLRLSHEEHDRDVIEYVVPNLVTTLRVMTRSVAPEAIPTMVGLVVSSAMGLSPTLWRKQYGTWTQAEMTALEATALLLAEHINRLTDDNDFATRLITDALTLVEEDED